MHAEANRAGHGSRVRAKVRVKRTTGNPKEIQRNQRLAQGQNKWAEMNLDTGAAVNTFPLNFAPDGAGDGRFFRTASGEWILDGRA